MKDLGRLLLAAVGLGLIVYFAGWLVALGVFLFGAAVHDIRDAERH